MKAFNVFKNYFIPQTSNLKKMLFDLQPTLEDEFVRLQPLKETDFEALYKIGSDPLLWEQHPNPNRYKKEDFEIFFKGAMESKSAFLIIDKLTDAPIGTSRYYDLDRNGLYVVVGYTFFARTHWGTTYNRATKNLLLNHAFEFVNSVFFHIWENNLRSQTAILKLGARKVHELEIAYYGEENKLNFIYQIDKTILEEVENE